MSSIFYRIFALIFVVHAYSTAQGIERNELIDLAQNILKSHSHFEEKLNNTLSPDVEQGFLDIKELVQSDLKNGNDKVSLDLYLLLQGILVNDFLSLQSLLTLQVENPFPEDLAVLIDFKIAQKLSFALKENRLAKKTKIIVHHNQKQTKCKVYANGSRVKLKNTFYVSAGVPIYLGLYCDNGLFEVQYIQPKPNQTHYTVTFNNLNLSKYKAYHAKIPSPTPSAQITDLPDLNKIQTQTAYSAQPVFIIDGGISYYQDFTNLRHMNISNLGLNKGEYFTISSKIQYSYIFTEFEFSQVQLKNIKEVNIKIEENLKNTELYYYFSSFYFKPSIGFEKEIYNLNNKSSLLIASSIQMLILQGVNRNYFAKAIGVKTQISFHNQLTNNISWGIKFAPSFLIGDIKGVQTQFTPYISCIF